MKLAYMIQAHKNYKQIVKLIDRLNDIDTDFFVHIDKKNDLLYEDVCRTMFLYDNVFMVKDRIDVNWSGFSQVQTTLRLLTSVIDTGKQYDYISLISGQDYPIKSNEYIKEFLQKNKGKEFIEVDSIDGYSWRLKTYNFFGECKKNRKLYIRAINKLFRMVPQNIVTRNNFGGLKLFKGSQWFTITYGCAENIINYIIENKDFNENFKYSACADEHYFQIIVMNSEFNSNIVNNNLRYIRWSKGKSSPEILKKTDIKELLCSDKLFARKIDIEVDKAILEEIDLSLEKGINQFLNMQKINKIW